jgi:hypothetical protein
LAAAVAAAEEEEMTAAAAAAGPTGRKEGRRAGRGGERPMRWFQRGERERERDLGPTRDAARERGWLRLLMQRERKREEKYA